MLIKESHTDVQITVDGKETTMSERAPSISRPQPGSGEMLTTVAAL